jgi:hypothetical protein
MKTLYAAGEAPVFYVNNPSLRVWLDITYIVRPSILGYKEFDIINQ